MDFHSLARRELQALCKKNKIPANMTNFAMADALKALEIVQGLEELLKPSESETAHSSVESPEKTEITSSIVPRTGRRTSARRKIQEEPESPQVLTSARRGTRRAIHGEVENAKLVLPETPALPSSRKGAPAYLSRRKMETRFKEEAEEKNKVPAATTTSKMETHGNQKDPSSVLKVYSTRRSRRLLEKEIDGIDSLQYDATDKEKPKDLEGILNEDSADLGKASEIKELYEQMNVSNSRIMNIDALEAHWDTKSEALQFSANARELKRNIQERPKDNHEVDDLSVKQEQSSQVFDEPELVSATEEHTEMYDFKRNKDADDEVHDENKDDHVDSHTISRVACEKSGESADILPLRNLEKGLKEEEPENEECDGDGFDTSLSDIENPTESAAPENGKGLADKGLCSTNSAAVVEPVIAPHSSVSVPRETNQSLNDEPVVNDLVSEDSAETEYDAATWSVSAAAEDQKQHTGLQNLASPKEADRILMEDQNDMGSEPELSDVQNLEELFDAKPPCDDAEAYKVQDLDSAIIGDDKPKGEVSSDDVEVDMYQPEHLTGTNQLENEEPVIETSNEVESATEKSVTIESPEQVPIDVSVEGKSGDAEVDFDYPEQSMGSKRLEDGEHSTPEKSVAIESAGQVAIDGSVEDCMTSGNAMDLCHSKGKHAIAVHECPPALVNQISSCTVISENDIIYQFADQESNFGNPSANPSALSGPSGKTLCPPISGLDLLVDMAAVSSSLLPATRTPLKKSSSKTPTTSRKINNPLDDKENIDNCGKKLALTKERGKKDNKEMMGIPEDTSLRKLKKMVKEKEDINKEKKDTAKGGRARLVLQKLSENQMAATAPENDN